MNRADTAGGAIAYREMGSPGQPRLLQIHGLGTGHQNFDLLTPLLSDELHVVDIDLPGYGESEELLSERSIDALADAAAAFIDGMGLAPVPVHGCSMGGCIAISLAARYPTLVDRLIITVSFGRVDNAAGVMFDTWKRGRVLRRWR